MSFNIAFLYKCFVDLEKNLRERWNDDFVIIFSNIKSKKKQFQVMVEVLLTIKYEKSKMVLMLDRRAKRGKRKCLKM